ncbi:MAG TPA: zinc ribbon domain-containing protein [Anaerolineae bacterium]|nr:zinc ribbon domain-containing protein [Anaerolineae bacterium]
MSTQPPSSTPPPPAPIAAGTQTYTCPQCASKMSFDAKSGLLACPSCGHKMPVPSATDAVQEHDLMQALQNTVGKSTGYGTEMKSINCQNCGATTNVQPNVTSTTCPFCGSNQIIEQKPDPNMIQPESVVPFAVDESRANMLFRTWLSKGFFQPGDLKQLGGGQKLRGVYLPFWTFDAHAESDWWAESGTYYYETEWVTVTRDGKTVREQRQVQKTRWWPSSGHHADNYDDVLVYATKSIDVRILQKVYPYDTAKLLNYKPEFLSGWAAESYQINLADGWNIGKGNINSEEYSKSDRQVPGDTHRNLRVNTSLSNLTYKHVLLPVWVASYRYNSKTFQFMINGQNGKVQGDKPISWIKVAIVVVIVLAIIGAIVYFVARSKSEGSSSTGELLMWQQYVMAHVNMLL